MSIGLLLHLSAFLALQRCLLSSRHIFSMSHKLQGTWLAPGIPDSPANTQSI